MIVVQLMGGLGNQMFEYAAARALAARHQTRLVLDSSWLDVGSSPGDPREYELGCFALEAPLVPIFDVARFRSSGLRLLLQRLSSRRALVSEIAESRRQDYEPAVLTAPDNSYLRGYWQSESYFKDAESLVRADFVFRDRLDENNRRVAAAIRAAPIAVSMHVRRGDYLLYEDLRRRLGALSPDYYARALELISNRLGDIHVFVFSDEPAWCRETLRLDHETTFLDGNAQAAWKDMHLMSLCDHHVIANSSFSWWGAWLNPIPTKVVVAPRPWLLDPQWRDERRTPPEWIRIDRAHPTVVGR